MTFGDKLRQYRVDNGLSLDDLAEKLGTTKQVLSRYELNHRTPKITVAAEYAEIIGIPVANLVDDNLSLYEGDESDVRMAADTGLNLDSLSEENRKKVLDYFKMVKALENKDSEKD